MDLTEDDVLEILKLFEHSKFDYLHLEQGGRKITVSKGGLCAGPDRGGSRPGPMPAPASAGSASVPCRNRRRRRKSPWPTKGSWR